MLSVKRRPKMKAPNKIQELSDAGVLKNTAETTALKNFINQVQEKEFTMADFMQARNGIDSQDRFELHFGTIALRKILSVDDPPVQAVIDSNLVPRLLTLMQLHEEPHLQVLRSL